MLRRLDPKLILNKKDDLRAMQNTKKIWLKNGLLISLLLHLLLFTSAGLILQFQPVFEKSPALYVPSYVYHPEKTATPNQPAPAPITKNIPTSKNGILKPAKFTNNEARKINQPIDASASKPTDPVHMVGDEKVDKPLLTLLGKAFYKHLFYPKAAMDFNVRGIAYVGFLLHPDGSITQLQLMKSSGADVLDRAAMNAVSLSAPVKGVNQYLSEEKFLVLGVIFG